jgi:hypothetical protein
MERIVALLTWLSLAVVLIAAFVVRHEPPPTIERKPRGPVRGAARRHDHFQTTGEYQ